MASNVFAKFEENLNWYDGDYAHKAHLCKLTDVSIQNV